MPKLIERYGALQSPHTLLKHRAEKINQGNLQGGTHTEKLSNISVSASLSYK